MRSRHPRVEEDLVGQSACHSAYRSACNMQRNGRKREPLRCLLRALPYGATAPLPPAAFNNRCQLTTR